VFLGCSYTDPVFGKTFRQFYPGTTNITDVVAYVQDDPDALFKCAVVTAFNSTTISYVNRTSVGNNAVLAQNTGSTITGNSQVAITAATNTTSTWPIRVIDVVPDTANSSGNFCEFICKFNAPYVVSTTTAAGSPLVYTTTSTMTGGHMYLNPTGV